MPLRRVPLGAGADVLEEAVEGDAEAEEKKEREEIGGQQRQQGKRHFELVGTGRRQKIVNGGDAHHVEEAAAKHVATGCYGATGSNAALWQRFVAKRAISASGRDFLAAEWTFSNSHVASSVVQTNE